MRLLSEPIGVKDVKCELYHDNFQNFKSYNIPKAQLVIADIPYCYDEQTECWTAEGWKKYTELTLNDTVMSLNAVTQEIEYSSIERIIIRDNDERMISFNNNNLNLLVTENHRMFVKSDRKRQGIGIRNVRWSSENGIRLAKKTGAMWFIPRSGYSYTSHSKVNEIVIPACDILTKGREHVKAETIIPLDVWLPFFGLWLADGCVCNSKASDGRQLYTVSIKQAGERRKAVMEMLERLPYKAIEYSNKGTDRSNINIYSKQLWLYMKQFGKSDEKFIPRWILDLPTEYLQLLWKWYTFGDSHISGTGIKISSISERLINGLQEIALKLGTLCQIRTFSCGNSTLYYFQYNPESRNIRYSGKRYVDDYSGKVWCITLTNNSVFLVRRNGLIAFSGNCLGNSFHASRPEWWKDGKIENGTSSNANKAAFNTDYTFNLAEYFHFCSKMLRKEPAKGEKDAPAMVVFCSFEQMQEVIRQGEKYGFKHYIPLVLIKPTSPSVLKANMKIVGATEYALVLYRDKLPKFRNEDENGVKHMVKNWFEFKKDSPKDISRIHPTQKPSNVIKKLIEIFTDPGDVVIDPVAGSAITLKVARDLGRNSYGFEISADFYKKAKEQMLQQTSQSSQSSQSVQSNGEENVVES